ncbi:endonuclease/exonuclease/phosphatase family protein [Chitinophaga horti]|uniref:Endonuclease/exonuclease/phosphatase family protein n=1 Tax=Chitinophaga horti TaxID=2920382 RepID=A0ABY6IX12_9BACT|nr:endonuclease/exonuclease/phosphatase family protein [Chitinophaga horti]UYQ91920.1 endonuclease/exonuclease/phosphatase family protein [Chitinophaga horti]
MKKYLPFHLVMLIALAGCSTSRNSRSGTAARQVAVLTYNVHHANPPSESKDVINLDTIAHAIRNSGATLVALQELDSVTIRAQKVFQLKALADKLGMHYYYGKAIPYEGGGYGVGILSKYPLTDTRTVVLPKIAGFKGEDRVVAMGRVELPGGKKVWFASTHLDVTKEENRQLQSNAIVKLAASLDAPLLIGGDFNATDEKGGMQSLFAYFADASAAKAPTIPNINPKRRIDYILFPKTANFRLISEHVLTESAYASDHLGYQAVLAY